MAVQIKKKETVAATQTAYSPVKKSAVKSPLVMSDEGDDSSDEIKELLEFVGDLDATIKAEKAKLKPKEVKLLEAKEKLVTMISPIDPQETSFFQSEHWAAELSAQATVRKLKDKQDLIKIIGMDVFIELADVKLGDLDKYLTDEQKQEVLSTSQSGSRTLKLTKSDL